MEKDQIVMIYKDIDTRRKPEGKAVLDFKCCENPNYEIWSVFFEGETGNSIRGIKKLNRKE